MLGTRDYYPSHVACFLLEPARKMIECCSALSPDAHGNVSFSISVSQAGCAFRMSSTIVAGELLELCSAPLLASTAPAYVN